MVQEPGKKIYKEGMENMKKERERHNFHNVCN